MTSVDNATVDQNRRKEVKAQAHQDSPAMLFEVELPPDWNIVSDEVTGV